MNHQRKPEADAEKEMTNPSTLFATLLAMMLRVTFRSPPFIVALAGDGVKAGASSPA